MTKDFSNLNTARAMQQIITAQGADIAQEEQDKHEKPAAQEKQRKPRKRYTAEEAQKILESGRNAKGLGGVKMPRMNMAFSPQNYDFIATLATARGQNYTEFVNHMVDLYREQYKDQYEQAKAFLNSF
jgi:hypothetical protein